MSFFQAFRFSRLSLALGAALTPVLIYAQQGQVNIPRIELMPNEPAPYNVRDWKWVAEKYDSFVYDLGKSGQYLPLAYVNPQGYNYPENPVFGLHTYVGTKSPQNSEGINVLPSLVGASLAGIDKSAQFGRDWTLMAQDFFNKKNGENIYLNNRNGSSGGDWWYDLMPNLYFYQLYALYPDMGGEADAQFIQIADRFLASVRALGGSDSPWSKAYMNYRAFNFKTMTPNPEGVPEPEAAGAYAWVLYQAYRQTGNPEYLKGAEWSLEFLSDWGSNPSYELQLPYGSYVAARMNAELGTRYNIEKMVNWSFDRGPLRGWGTIVGKWGGFDVSGLVGEANDNGNDYAFQLNGVQQAAALVPMLRYDKRFARAIGKWMLNLSNATRLYFPGFLSSSQQDAAAWSDLHDPDRVMAYEALREKWDNKSPFSTGDALKGNWAATNLSLYSTGSIGYLGALVEKTNVDKILRIDLLKTDFFGDEAYPTYLYFNPYSSVRLVEIDLGSESRDVYDALSEEFLLQGGSGTVEISIPANQAILVSLTPAGGSISYEQNKMLIDGVVVDYGQSAEAFQYRPRIQALTAQKPIVEITDSTLLYASVQDGDSEDITYTWSAVQGTLKGAGETVSWLPPAGTGSYEIRLVVADDTGLRDTAILQVQVVAEINKAPLIQEIQKNPPYSAPGGHIDLSCLATDPNNDAMTYTWSSNGGSITGSGASVQWTAPATEGIYQVQVTVTDDAGLSSIAATNLLVKVFVADPDGKLIAYYPYSGNANDASGNLQHGGNGGALFVPDRFGTPSSALRFDGVNDVVTVPNTTLLNCQEGITVSTWCEALALPEKEMFLLSHGSWQNRWKISLTPEKKLRWTVNTLNKVDDLDAPMNIVQDSLYHLTATYDGSLMAIYINGRLESYKPLSGLIRTATVPLLHGQMLPGNTEYNFQGILDEVRIYDHALTPEAVAALYQETSTAIKGLADEALSITPNPASDWLNIVIPAQSGGHALVSVYDLSGQLILREQAAGAGQHRIDTGSWTPGLYIVLLHTGSALASGRFVKQ